MANIKADMADKHLQEFSVVCLGSIFAVDSTWRTEQIYAHRIIHNLYNFKYFYFYTEQLHYSTMFKKETAPQRYFFLLYQFCASRL